MDLGIKDKVALVTGGNSGIGCETARVLLQEGAKVIITGTKPQKTEKAVAELSQYGPVSSYLVDVRDKSALENMHKEIQAEFGSVDILVHSAGISGKSGLFHELSEKDWIETLDVDLMGAIRTVQTFLPDLRKNGWGRLIFISSENGKQPYKEEIPYDCAKSGLLTLAKGLSKTYAKEGLLINAVSPAFIETPMTDEMMKELASESNISMEEAVEKFLEEKRPNIELKRRGKPEEVASVIAFLCSDKASFVNGSNIRVDAGSVSTI